MARLDGDKRNRWLDMWLRCIEYIRTRSGFSVSKLLRNECVVEHASHIDTSFLFTTSAGVFLYDAGAIHHLVEGFTFGLARDDTFFYCTQEVYFDPQKHKYKMTRVLRFRLEGTSASDLRCIRAGLPHGAHQLAVQGDSLLFPDSVSNLLRCFPLSRAYEWGVGENDVSHAYDAACDEKGRHLNSVCVTKDETWLLAHNDYHKTGRNSAIYVLGKDGAIAQYISLEGRCAHDIVVDGPYFYFCDSEGGTVKKGEQVLFTSPEGLFTRGLMLGRNYHVIGASERVHRSMREQTTAYLYVLNGAFELLDTIRIGRLPCGRMGGNVKAVFNLDPANQRV